MDIKVVFPQPGGDFNKTPVIVPLEELLHLMYCKDVLEVVRKNLKVSEGVSIVEFTSKS